MRTRSMTIKRQKDDMDAFLGAAGDGMVDVVREINDLT